MKTNEFRSIGSGCGVQNDNGGTPSITGAVIDGKYASRNDATDTQDDACVTHGATGLDAAESTGAATPALACYAAVPGDVVAECERLHTVAKALRLEALRRIRDILAPYGQFKQWCADHDENYTTITHALDDTRTNHSKRQVVPGTIAPLLEVPVVEAAATPFIALSPATSIEYYTPAPYVEAARAVMGDIDLDPASCAEANATVQASLYYDVAANGFDKPWTGRVWLNPPYGRDADGSRQDKWTQRLLAQYAAGITTQAVLLCNASVDTAWFQRLVGYPICFPCGRIDFVLPKGHSSTSGSTHGSALIYFGPQRTRFIAVFRRFGMVVEQARAVVESDGDAV